MPNVDHVSDRRAIDLIDEFTTDRDDRAFPWPERLHTAKQQQITFTGTADHPALSPDRRYLAYASGDDASQLVVQDLVTGRTRTAVERPGIYDVKWSPTGRDILVATGGGNLFIEAADGSSSKRFTGALGVWSPDASEIGVCCPDGDKLTFFDVRSGLARFVDPGGALPVHSITSLDWASHGLLLAHVRTQTGIVMFTLRPDGSDAREIYRDPDDTSSIDSSFMPHTQWGRNGSHIYYIRKRGLAPELAVLDYDSSNGVAHEGGVALAGASFEGASFAISSDEKSVFLSHVSHRSELVLTVGDQQTKLTSDTENKVGLAISPDRRSIAFASGLAPRMRIRVHSLSDGQETIIPSPNGAILALAWSPDGKELLHAVANGTKIELWRVVVETSLASRIPADDVSQAGEVAWPATNQIIYRKSGDRNYVILDLVSGERHSLIDDDSVGGVNGLKSSPDGRRVAFQWSRNSPGLGSWVFSLADRRGAPLYTADFLPIGWSDDGTSVLLADLSERTVVFAVDPEVHAIRVVARTQLRCSAGVAAGDLAILASETNSSDLWEASVAQTPRAIAPPAPPDRHHDSAPNPTPTNLGLDGATGQPPSGWWASPNVEITDHGAREGRHAVLIDAKTSAGLSQRFDAASYRGRRIRFRVQARAETSVWLNVSTFIGEERSYAGSTGFAASPWQSREVIADIRPDAELIEISILATDAGRAWVDDSSVEIVGEHNVQDAHARAR